MKATATLGPGFLSYYWFQVARDTGSYSIPFRECKADTNGAVSECDLKLVDVLPLWDSRGQSEDGGMHVMRLGANGTAANSGPFEHTIGIY